MLPAFLQHKIFAVTEISVLNYCFGPKYNKELLKICDWLSKIMGSLFVEDGY